MFSFVRGGVRGWGTRVESIYPPLIFGNSPSHPPYVYATQRNATHSSYHAAAPHRTAVGQHRCLGQRGGLQRVCRQKEGCDVNSLLKPGMVPPTEK
jgi:hypothetical protein